MMNELPQLLRGKKKLCLKVLKLGFISIKMAPMIPDFSVQSMTESAANSYMSQITC